jgi:hypothetical protein
VQVNFFKSTAKGPEVLVGTMFACVGRLVICNQGYFPKVTVVGARASACRATRRDATRRNVTF